MAYEPTPFDPYVQAGLQKAQGLMDTTPAFQYPQYVSSALRPPSSEQYYNYMPTSPLAQVQAPNYQMTAGNYQGLMGGNYDQFQQALQRPGEIAAQTAYQQGYGNLQNTMGGRGMYGSSIMANQATQGLDKTYQNTLATNAAQAAAQRYAMQQQELQAMNTFNLSREQDLNKYGLQATQLAQTQNAADWQARAQEASRQMQYGEGAMNWRQQTADQLRNWQNQQDYEKFSYDLASQAATRAAREQEFNQALALAGQGAPLANMANQSLIAQQNLAAQQAIANQNAKIASQSGWLSAGGGLLGGVLGGGSSGQSNLSYLGGLIGSGYDYLKNL